MCIKIKNKNIKTQQNFVGIYTDISLIFGSRLVYEIEDLWSAKSPNKLIWSWMQDYLYQMRDMQ